MGENGTKKRRQEADKEQLHSKNNMEKENIGSLKGSHRTTSVVK